MNADEHVEWYEETLAEAWGLTEQGSLAEAIALFDQLNVSGPSPSIALPTWLHSCITHFSKEVSSLENSAFQCSNNTLTRSYRKRLAYQSPRVADCDVVSVGSASRHLTSFFVQRRASIRGEYRSRCSRP